MLILIKVHCVINWGAPEGADNFLARKPHKSAFRPHFMDLAEVKHLIGCPVALLTGTMTSAMVPRLYKALHLNPKEVQEVTRRCDR